jgi:Domain of unknown function (DUF1707)
MSDVIAQPVGPPVRASDSERDQVVAQLQRHFADGRLTQAELEERVGAALAARTRDQLRALMADLPGEDARPARATVLDPCLLCLLLFLCPPAGVACWLLSRRGIGAGWLSQRQLAGVPNWAWILIIAGVATAAVHR